MPFTYEISGALPVVAHCRHNHARRFAQGLVERACVYFATDTVTHSLVIRIRGALCDDEIESVEKALAQFSQKWARAGAIFSRVRYGEPSFLAVGLACHVELLQELADEHVQLRTFLRREAWLLQKLQNPNQQGRDDDNLFRPVIARPHLAVEPAGV